MVDGTQQRGITRADGVALKEYLEKQLDSQAALYDSRLAALEKATEVAAKVLGDRLAGMNEFREAMGDLSNRMVTRAELMVQLDKVDIQLKDLRKSRDESAGKASQTSVLIALGFGVAGLIFGIIDLLV